MIHPDEIVSSHHRLSDDPSDLHQFFTQETKGFPCGSIIALSSLFRNHSETNDAPISFMILGRSFLSFAGSFRIPATTYTPLTSNSNNRNIFFV